MRQKRCWDEIRIEDLRVYATHGVFDFEQEKGQFFYVSAVLYLDTEKAGKTDDLTASVHYGEVSRLIVEKMQEQSYLLLERAAEVVVESILKAFPLIDHLTLQIRKPQAPIGLPFGRYAGEGNLSAAGTVSAPGGVSVCIHRGWHLAALSVGSNMGDKENYIRTAFANLQADEKICDAKLSTLLVTKPYGGVEQDDFVNGAILLRTLYSPWELLERIGKEEQAANRERLIHWGPRTLDLDIVLYEEQVIYTENLKIPHVDMCNRAFVLEPLAEIAPQLMHPLAQKPVWMLLQELGKNG